MLILITPSDVVVLVWENNENIPRTPAVMSSLLITLFKATLIIYLLHQIMRARWDMRASPRMKTTAATTFTDSLWMIMEGMKDINVVWVVRSKVYPCPGGIGPALHYEGLGP